MKESVAAVVARFFNVPESALVDSFELPRERLHGSIARRILYTALKRHAETDLPGVWTATTYGELLNGTAAVTNSAPAAKAVAVPRGESGLAVGIDIETAAHLPWSGDPWKESFYAENFTEAEVAYATRQTDPRLTLCGLWAAKEAVIKCGAEYAALRPVQIEVAHDDAGRPRALIDGAPSGLEISISHADGTAVAVAVRGPARAVIAPLAAPVPSSLPPVEMPRGGGNWVAVGLALLALAVAIAALVGK